MDVDTKRDWMEITTKEAKIYYMEVEEGEGKRMWEPRILASQEGGGKEDL